MKKSVSPVVAVIVILIVVVVVFAVYKLVLGKGSPKGEPAAKGDIAPMPAEMQSGGATGMGPQGSEGAEGAVAPPAEGGGGAMGEQGR